MQEEDAIINSNTSERGLSKRKKMKAWLYRKMKVKETTAAFRYKWRFFGSAFKWKRVNLMKMSFFDNLVFRIMSFFEAVVLVATVSFFFLCCGCHF